MSTKLEPDLEFKCTNCRWSDWESKVYDTMRRKDLMNCRLLPPVVQQDGESHWPVVYEDHWCSKLEFEE